MPERKPFAVLLVLLALVAMLSLTGADCSFSAQSGSSSDRDEDEDPTALIGVGKGNLVDAPVEGVQYQSGDLYGVTGPDGGFRYETGGMVRFYIGDILLGQAPAGKAVVTPLDLVPDGNRWDEIVAQARAVEAAGATIINSGIGWHEARIPTIAAMVPRAAFTWVTRRMKAELTVPLITSNRINAPETAEAVLARGEADMISMARPLLADPAAQEKLRVPVGIGIVRAIGQDAVVRKGNIASTRQLGRLPPS